ncbi:hypothetical protein K504DRAFT_459028 [Pleomassaria siparia CBS 279.74]|uniref:MYND-type domain-containing protein n=1 Tax=Pleomassaria siparia CBS 279.74 TaxID=1314801 RepID=A0A6G1K187_9PLEO|nr:hypothetical protein K504DRAFT_459028 [Pleomassaria siparia CBS 279.74]
MSSSSAVRSCTVCSKGNANLCSRCKSASYCSKSCQQSDWCTHKLLCASFTTFATSDRPTPEHYRGILFNPEKSKPEFIWLLSKWSSSYGDNDYDVDYQSPQIRPLLGSDSLLKHLTIQHDKRLDKQLSDTIFITYRDTFLVDGSRPSRSIASITATQPGEYHDWRGPIVAYGKKGLGIDPLACRDLDMNDFRHITDHFLSYAYVPPPDTSQASTERVKGVRINCVGDVKLFKKPHFEEVEVAGTDSIFSMHDTSDIADRIELPILTRRCPPDPKWVNTKGGVFGYESPFNNQDATFLHQCCDPRAEFDINTGSLGWGWCPMKWQNGAGSVIVVRKDKKLLLPMHMEALARYCRYEIRPLLAHSTGEFHPEKPMKREEVLRMICRPTFVIYWAKFAGEKKDYATPSPYENGL